MKHSRLLLAALLSFALVSCGGGGGRDNDKDDTPKELEVSFLSSLKIDMNGAQGFAIKKGQSNAKKALNPKLALADGEEEEEEELNFIYTTTESYSSGDVEYDGGSITKVSFTKQTEVQTDVYDANSSLIQSDTVIHQEDIPAEINKLYATSTFTYMQYIPAGADSYRDYPYYDDSGELRYTRIDVRPDTLVYDADGVSTYDRYEYYSSPLQRNFVIDNKNGYIYEIEDFGFYEIIGEGIVKARASDDATSLFKLAVGSDHKLSITDIIPNHDLNECYYMGTDKDGWTFISIDDDRIKTDSIDEANKVYYYSASYHDGERKYVAFDLEAKVAYLFHYEREEGFGRLSVPKLDQVFDNGSFKTYSQPSDLTMASFDYYGGFYKGKWYTKAEYINDSNFAQELFEDSLSFKIDADDEAVSVRVFEDHLLAETADGYLYGKTIKLGDYLNKNVTLTLKDFEQISNTQLTPRANYYRKVGDNEVLVKDAYTETSITGEILYQLRFENGKFELVKMDDVAYTADVYIFQPING